MRYVLAMAYSGHDKIGVMADSHSHISLMLEAIHALLERGATRIIHLGDICDSLTPQCMDEAVDILTRYGIKAVLGNNDHVLLTEYLSNNPDGLKQSTISFLREMPYTITVGEFCFTHSLPFDWPAATRRPLSEYIPHVIGNSSHPYRIIFRGHSHMPSVIEIRNGGSKEIRFRPGDRIALRRDRAYLITVGAVEDGACALFDPLSYEFLPMIFSEK